jgi:hypothetical protein
MAVLLLMTVLSAAAITFFVCFFTKLHNENTPHTGRVETIAPSVYVWKGEGSVPGWKSGVASRAGLVR